MRPKLITKNAVKNSLNLKGFKGTCIAALIYHLAGFGKLNRMYPSFTSYQGRDFIAAMLKEFKISFEIDEKELEYIPQEGAFIVTSNHPLGAIDSLLLLHIISSTRPEIKTIANFLFTSIPNLSSFFFEVNPFTENKELASSFSGLRMASTHLQNGGCLTMFPAGEVSTYYGKSVIEDKEWQLPIIKMIRNSGVTVVPAYFHGTNSKMFHWLGRIHPSLRTLRLAKEMLNKRGKTIKLSIGRPISPTEIAEFKTLKELSLGLRARTYALESNLTPNAHIEPRDDLQPIALPKNRRAMQKEISTLPVTAQLFTTGGYSCYLVNASSIPTLLHEIGRRREEAFRAVGEGTGTPLDLDEYDQYYKHLILWDKRKSRLVGAYRLGIGREIMSSKGVDGFYSSTLFHYNKNFLPILGSSMELGRSFVVLDYQREALPLLLLIKGLLYAVSRDDQIKYLFGPVSISSWYPMFYRSLMIYYLREKHQPELFKGGATPKTPFVPDYLRSTPADLLHGKMDSIEKFDRFILRLSNGNYRLPTLVKKYIKINCKMVDFNVDPAFNFCVDGLVLLDLNDVPKSEIEILTKGDPDSGKIFERFGYSITE